MESIIVEFNLECPFIVKKYYAFSEYTNGYDYLCSLLDKKDCVGLCNNECPLKKGKNVLNIIVK